jgi:hypothetical protein
MIYDLDTRTLKKGYAALRGPTDPDACYTKYYRLTSPDRFTGLCATPRGESCLAGLDTAKTTTDVNGTLVVKPEITGCIPGSNLVAPFSTNRDRDLFHWSTNAFASLTEVGGRSVLETRGIFNGVLGPRVDVAAGSPWNAA